MRVSGVGISVQKMTAVAILAIAIGGLMSLLADPNERAAASLEGTWTIVSYTGDGQAGTYVNYVNGVTTPRS